MCNTVSKRAPFRKTETHLLSPPHPFFFLTFRCTVAALFLFVCFLCLLFAFACVRFRFVSYLKEFYIGELRPADRPLVVAPGRGTPSPGFLEQVVAIVATSHRRECLKREALTAMFSLQSRT